MEANDTKFKFSIAKFRENMNAVTAARGRIKRLNTSDNEILVHGKRLRVETNLRVGFHESPLPVEVYPSKKRGITLNSWDLERLEGTEFLDDQLVNFFAKRAYDTLGAQKHQNIELCDRHLYNQLTRDLLTEDKCTEENVEKNLTKVVGWYRKTAGLKKRWWIVPICESMHWYLAAVQNDESTNTIFFLDSVRHTRRERSGVLLGRLVKKVWGHVRDVTVDELQVNQQRNSYDCGVHVIHNVEKLVEAFNHTLFPSKGDLERVLGQPTVTRKELHHSLIQGPGVQLAEGRHQEPPRSISPKPMDQSTDTPPVMELQPGAELPLTNNIIIKNATHHTATIGGVTMSSLQDSINKAYANLNLCRQRKRKYTIQIAADWFRIEIGRYTGVCKVYITEKEAS